MKSYTVKNRNEAWKKAAEIFPTDYEKDINSSNKAGYPVYRSNVDSMFYYWISDLSTSLELNMGADTVRININEEAAENEEVIRIQQNESIPFSELKAGCYAKHITEEAKTGCLNMSAIYTKLIQEAGRICEYFASDILIDLEGVEKWINECSKSEYAPARGISFCFGFRKMGVDHWEFAKNRKNSEPYKLYRLDLSAARGYVKADLYEAEKQGGIKKW